MTEKWLSIVEYARTYNVSDMTVRRRIKTGKLRAVLQEGKYFIPVPVKEDRAPQMTAPSPSMQPAPHKSQPQPPRRPSGEMQVIKGHPAPQRTFQAAHQAPGASYEHARAVAQQPSYEEPAYPAYQAFDDDEAVTGVIPASLRRAATSGEVATVDARALLAFCEASMKKVQESERRQVERFKSKLEALEQTVVARDGEIKTLKQQLEDLQLLVKVLERKRSG